MIRTISLISEKRIIPLKIGNTVKQIRLIAIFAINTGKKSTRSGRFKEKCESSKKEKSMDTVMTATSMLKIIQCGVNFFEKKSIIIVNLIFDAG